MVVCRLVEEAGGGEEAKKQLASWNLGERASSRRRA